MNRSNLPDDVMAHILEMLESRIGSFMALDPAVLIDGSEGSLMMARIAHAHSYCRPEQWESASALAMDVIFAVDRLDTRSVNQAVLDDVWAITGDVGPYDSEYAVMVYLALTKASMDGHRVLLSPCGADAIMGTSKRFDAAFGRLVDECDFEMRKSVWAGRTPLQRYSMLVGHPVDEPSNDDFDTIQRHELIIECGRLAQMEKKLAGVLEMWVVHPFLDDELTAYTASLPSSVRYDRKPKDSMEST